MSQSSHPGQCDRIVESLQVMTTAAPLLALQLTTTPWQVIQLALFQPDSLLVVASFHSRQTHPILIA